MLKLCSCRACRAGRHAIRSKTQLRGAVRRLRRQTRQALALGKEPPKAIAGGYTD